MKKALVTGATGFLGSHVVRSLLKAGLEVTATKRSSSNLWRLDEIINRIVLVDMDMFDPDGVDKAVSLCKPDLIVNCAAYGVDYREQDYAKTVKTNVNGAYTLLEAGAKHGTERFIQIGSCFEYGEKDHPARENEALEPTALYGATKAAATLLLLNMARALHTELTVLRPFGLWGPLEGSHRLVPQVIDACLGKKTLDLTGCEQIRDYIYAPDMADLIASISLLENFPVNEVINLGSGCPVVLREFVLSIAGYFGGESLMRFGQLAYRPTKMWHLVADVGKQSALVGPISHTPLEEGIRAMTKERAR